MQATPMYETVVEDLQIDPGRIAARPAWSFEIAERVRKHRRKVLRSSTPKKRSQARAKGPRTKAARNDQGRTRRAASAKTKPEPGDS